MKNRIVASAVGIVMLAWPSPIAAADTSAPSYDGGRVHPGNPVMRVDLNLVRCLPDGSARYRVVVFNRGKGARHLNYYWRETLYGPGGAGEISMSAKNTGSLRFEVLPGNGLMDLWFYPRYQWEQKSYAFAQVVNPCG